MLVSRDDLTEEFEAYPIEQTPPVIEHLQDRTEAVRPSDGTWQGFWTGGSAADPHWVIESLAVTCADAVSWRTVRQTLEDCLEQYVRSYDEQTPSAITFDSTLSEHDQTVGSRVAMSYQPATSRALSSPLFVDLQRYVYANDILVGTSVFGPEEQVSIINSLLNLDIEPTDRDPEALFTRIAADQQTRLTTLTDVQ